MVDEKVKLRAENIKLKTENKKLKFLILQLQSVLQKHGSKMSILKANAFIQEENARQQLKIARLS